MQRLKTRPQFQAAMAAGTVARTAHFALHRLVFPVDGVASELFPVSTDAWIGALVPKRWARRAVTRNAIKRQVYSLGAAWSDSFPHAAHVVRLRAGFDKRAFISASSDSFKHAVRAELIQLFGRVYPRSEA